MHTFTHWTAFKGRMIDPDLPVMVYRNLHRQCYSVKQRGLVIGHCSAFTLHSFLCVVNESGRQRVIKERKKNVHAYIKGYVFTRLTLELLHGKRTQQNGKPIIYNPFKYDSFVYADNEKAVNNRGHVFINGNSNGVKVL